MEDYFMLIISAIFVNNILLIKFLGNCPFIGVSSSMDSATGMSAACIFVNVLASSMCWIVQKYVLEPLSIEYIQTLAFILIIAGLVQLVEIILQKVAPPLYRALGIYLP